MKKETKSRMELFEQPANTSKIKNSYSASDIEVLEGLEPVRKRPGMYIGGINSQAMHHLVSEVVDNSMDEAIAGHATTISVTLIDEQTISISDNGRGIPVDPHPKFPDKSALEVILTTLHAGGKFSDKAYNTAGGLHGVGISVVNALSSHLVVEVTRESNLYSQTYSRGLPTSSLQTAELPKKKRSGTKVTFSPDSEIFGSVHLEPKIIYDLIKAKAYLFKGVTMEWKCLDQELAAKAGLPTEDIIHFPDGLVDYLKASFKEAEAITKLIFAGEVNVDARGARVEWAMGWHDQPGFVHSYCNTIYTPLGGTHEQGMRAAILKAVKDFAEMSGNKKGQNIIIDDILASAQLLLSVFIHDPLFQGQTKEKLVSPQVAKMVEGAIKDHLDHWLSNNRAEAQMLLDYFVDQAEQRMLRKNERITKRKDAMQKMKLPGKLADCTKKIAAGTELFIVEGDSAGGSAKQARDRELQAILPLRGKILNVANSTADKIKQNQEIRDLEIALNCGYGDKYDEMALRYEKIIIMTDADVDGAHIASLLMTFFYIKMPRLISDGHLYIAKPPLYRISCLDKTYYAHTEEERDEIARNLAVKHKNKKIEIGRFKGLGEMTAQQLKETTMDKTKRVLTQVKIDDFASTSQLVNDLMGKNPEKRFDFITSQALNQMQNIINNLDL